MISPNKPPRHFLDTIKLIAYRAETALAQLAREKMHRLDDARSLIRQLFRTEVDLVPDQQNKTRRSWRECGQISSFNNIGVCFILNISNLKRATRIELAFL
jgi:hypothetical protein